ncbi:hypothetical protein [Pseudonocardia sp. HH130629-09]|uniref:hypothetical protein n=1 Tax=Pseudonocardia sp. HH130629-09 TaxID=1641402 RepID=UPI0006CB0610|nr:hypothetical protein [Pseudonocardia sp. HH130629-09]ALE85062.1 hypothetical protein XF36_19525 [Pseudonocardia sp. HH130629-09]
MCAFGSEFLAASADVGDEVGVELVGQFQGADQGGASLLDVGDGLRRGADAALVVSGRSGGDLVGCGPEELRSVSAEHVVGEESVHRRHYRVFLDPVAAGVTVGDRLAGFRGACVVGATAAGLPEQPASAPAAEQVRAQ